MSGTVTVVELLALERAVRFASYMADDYAEWGKPSAGFWRELANRLGSQRDTYLRAAGIEPAIEERVDQIIRAAGEAEAAWSE